MPLQELQEKTTSTEFLEWQHYLDLDANAFHREDYFLANIAKAIMTGQVKKPEELKIEDFLLKFKTASNEAPVQLTPEEKAAKSKAFWLQALGVKENQ